MVTSLAGGSQIDAFAAGELDIAPISYVDAGWIAYDRDLGPSLRVDPELSVSYYGFDTRRAPFNDVRVRQAFAKAVDWRRLATLDEPGSSVPATGMVPPGMPGAPAGDFMPAYDPAGARQLLADAGYPGGKGLAPVSFVVPLSDTMRYDEAIVTMLRENLGVTIDYSTMDYATYQQRLATDPSAGLEPGLGRRLSRPQRLPRRAAGDRVHGEPGWVVERRFRRRHRRPPPPRRARRTPPPAYATALGIVKDQVPMVPVSSRDVLLAGPRRPPRCEPAWDGHPPPGGARVGQRPMTRPATQTRLRPTRLVRLLAAFAFIAALLAPAVPVNAADVSLGTPVETATYGQGITFTVPVTAGASVDRAELRLLFPGALGPFIIVVPTQTAATAGTLDYTLDLTGGAGLHPEHADRGHLGGGHDRTARRSRARRARSCTPIPITSGSTLKGDLMTVHWYTGPQSFARTGARAGREGIEGHERPARRDRHEAGGLLHLRGPAKLPSQHSGRGRARTRSAWPSRTSAPCSGSISPETLNDPTVAATVPHELIHLVFDTAVHNPYRFPPHWLNEGLAVYLSEGYNDQRRSLVEEAVRSRNLIPLDGAHRPLPGGRRAGVPGLLRGRLGHRLHRPHGWGTCPVRAGGCVPRWPHRRRGVHQGPWP